MTTYDLIIRDATPVTTVETGQVDIAISEGQAVYDQIHAYGHILQ